MKHRLVSAAFCVGIFYAVALAIMLLSSDKCRPAHDERVYHYPTILHFHKTMNYSDYNAAMTPGYHILMSLILSASPGSLLTLKLVNSGITAILLGFLCIAVSSRDRDTPLTALLVLPVIPSLYFLPSGVWLLPDNLAWLTVLLILYLALRGERYRLCLTLMSIVLMIAVVVRQTNIWLAAVIGLSALGVSQSSENGERQLLQRIAAASIALLPAILALGCFAYTWRGLVPPSFAEQHAGLSLSSPAFYLSVVAFYSAFYAPYIWPELSHRLSESRQALALFASGGAMGFALSLISPTDWCFLEGRASGLWNFVRITPLIDRTSILICVLSSLGGCMAIGWLLVVEHRTRWVLGTASLAFMAVQLVNRMVGERYCALLVFMSILFALSDILKRSSPKSFFRWAPAGPILLTAFNLAVLMRALM